MQLIFPSFQGVLDSFVLISSGYKLQMFYSQETSHFSSSKKRKKQVILYLHDPYNL